MKTNSKRSFWGVKAISVVVFAMVIMLASPASALVSNNFLITFEGITDSPDISGWYRWTYSVEVLENTFGLSHVTIGLDNCWLDDPVLREQILTATGYEIGPFGEFRKYADATVGYDGSTGISGIKWESIQEEGNLTYGELNVKGEKDYFYFTIPGNTIALETSEAVAKGGTHVSRYDIESPACPENGCDKPIPEPASLLLLGGGMLGAFLRRRKNKVITA